MTWTFSILFFGLEASIQKIKTVSVIFQNKWGFMQTFTKVLHLLSLGFKWIFRICYALPFSRSLLSSIPYWLCVTVHRTEFHLLVYAISLISGKMCKKKLNQFKQVICIFLCWQRKRWFRVFREHIPIYEMIKTQVRNFLLVDFSSFI